MYYSSKNSKEFWNKINSIENKEKHDLLYSLGCMLRSIEHHVLSILEIEDKKENTNKYNEPTIQRNYYRSESYGERIKIK